MGISTRQHLASLVAVFLALLIGVLVGVAVMRQPGLEARLKDLTDEVAQRHEERLCAGVAKEFAERALPILMRDKLNGRSVAMLVTATSHAGAAERAIRDALEVAGATVVTKATFDPDFVAHCDESRDQLLADLGLKPNPGGSLAEAVVGRTAQAVARGDTAAFRPLSRRGLVRIDQEVDGTPTLAIVVGGAKTPAPKRLEHLDLPLIRILRSSPTIERVVGCETSDAVESVMRAYQREDVSTIDNVDTAPGQFSLVLALAGVEGDYGMKRSAKRYFPEMPEEP